MECW
jgi:hypothetical protein